MWCLGSSCSHASYPAMCRSTWAVAEDSAPPASELKTPLCHWAWQLELLNILEVFMPFLNTWLHREYFCDQDFMSDYIADTCMCTWNLGTHTILLTITCDALSSCDIAVPSLCPVHDYCVHCRSNPRSFSTCDSRSSSCCDWLCTAAQPSSASFNGITNLELWRRRQFHQVPSTQTKRWSSSKLVMLHCRGQGAQWGRTACACPAAETLWSMQRCPCQSGKRPRYPKSSIDARAETVLRGNGWPGSRQNTMASTARRILQFISVWQMCITPFLKIHCASILGGTDGATPQAPLTAQQAQMHMQEP